MKKPIRVAITTGDLDGIGLEIASKALSHIKPTKGVQFYLWRGLKVKEVDLLRLDRSFKRKTVTSWSDALAVTPDFNRSLIEISSPLSPAHWVELMAQSALSKSIDALVTGPLSKTGIQKAGLKDNGHTGILKRVAKVSSLFMSFLGKEMNVTLATGHVSLEKAYRTIDENRLLEACSFTYEMIPKLSPSLKSKPIALVGVNPHAGEDGIIDSKEESIFKPVIHLLEKQKIHVVGPLVPDVCFQKAERKKYSYYIASYHDQGLIPFKMLHGAHNGIQLTLGLPFIRTSVNHGTAKDIFGKNKADYGSMKKAILIAIGLTNNKPIKW